MHWVVAQLIGLRLSHNLVGLPPHDDKLAKLDSGGRGYEIARQLLGWMLR